MKNKNYYLIMFYIAALASQISLAGQEYEYTDTQCFIKKYGEHSLEETPNFKSTDAQCLIEEYNKHLLIKAPYFTKIIKNKKFPPKFKNLESKISTCNQISQIKNYYQVDALKQQSILDALESKIITFDQILTVDNQLKSNDLTQQATELMTDDNTKKMLLNRLIKINQDVDLEQATKLSLLQLRILCYKNFMAFFTDNNTINFNFNMLALLQNQKQINAIKELINLQLLKKDTEDSKNKFTLAQALRLNNIHLRQLPLFKDRLKNEIISPDEFIASFADKPDLLN